MLPSCKQVTELLSEDIDKPLTGFRRFKLKLHLMMCRYCRRYESQLSLSGRAINLLLNKTHTHLPEEALKQKMLTAFRQSQQEKSESDGLKKD